MTQMSTRRNPIALLRTSLATLLSNPPVILPFICIAFIQLFIFEVLMFSTRYPLNIFFGPIIRRIEGEIFLHYPFNYIVLIKWWQNSFLQSAFFVLISSVFLGAAVAAIDTINNNRTVNYNAVFRRSLSAYIHLILASALSVGTMFLVSALHGLVVGRALMIRSTEGMYFILKQLVVISAPYVNLLVAVVITTLFIYLIPAIIIDKKKIGGALVANFAMLRKSFGFTFMVVFLSALLYVPAILLKTFSPTIQKSILPEFWTIIPVLSVLISLFIDAIQYTALTTYYLLKKEEK